MDNYFVENLNNVSFDTLLNFAMEAVMLFFILSLLISFISWAFWLLVRTFRDISKR
jgi:hypothetical protein